MRTESLYLVALRLKSYWAKERSRVYIDAKVRRRRVDGVDDDDDERLANEMKFPISQVAMSQSAHRS